MRVTVRGLQVEGTVSEIAELITMMDEPPVENVATLPKRNDATPFVSEDVAYAVLTRRHLAEIQGRLLRRLYDAGDDWTPATELQQTLGLTTREFAGVLGAFGRRLSNTEGAGSRSFFDQYWDSENGYNLYRLPPTVRAALERAEVMR